MRRFISMIITFIILILGQMFIISVEAGSTTSVINEYDAEVVWSAKNGDYEDDDVSDVWKGWNAKVKRGYANIITYEEGETLQFYKDEKGEYNISATVTSPGYGKNADVIIIEWKMRTGFWYNTKADQADELYYDFSFRDTDNTEIAALSFDKNEGFYGEDCFMGFPSDGADCAIVAFNNPKDWGETHTAIYYVDGEIVGYLNELPNYISGFKSIVATGGRNTDKYFHIGFADLTIGAKSKRGFDITRDGWPFPNSAYGFKYFFLDEHIPQWGGKFSYKIPEERWVEVYGEAVLPFVTDHIGEEWGGNCYGMCGLAYKIYNGDIEWNEDGEVNEVGYDIINIVDGSWEKLPSVKESSRLCKQIERYQISQYSTAVLDNDLYIRDTYREMFQTVVPLIEDRQTMGVVVSWVGENGEKCAHALLIDTSREVFDIDDEWKRIYLYDPNFPHYDNDENLDLPDCYGKWDNRYIEINIKTGEWRIDVRINTDSGDTWVKKEGYSDFSQEDDEYLYFADFTTLPNNFNKKLTFYKAGRLLYNAQDLRVEKKDGTLIFELKKGRVITSKYAYRLMAGPGSLSCVDFDADLSECYIEMSEGTIAVFDDDGMCALTSDGEVSIEMDLDEHFISTTALEDVNIVVTNEIIKKNGSYFAATAKGEIEEDEDFVITYQDNQLLFDSKTTNLFDITSYSDNKITEYENVDMSYDGTLDKYDADEYKNEKDDEDEEQKKISFSDVSSSASYAKAVETMAEYGVITGYEDGTFRPNNTVTRAEAAAMIVRMMGKADSVKNGRTIFSDVDKDHWASGYINCAVEHGIINGMGDGTFDKYGEVTYGQIVKMIVCMLGYQDLAEVNGGYSRGGYLYAGSVIKLTQGISGTANAAVSRATVARLLYNALDIEFMDPDSFYDGVNGAKYKTIKGKTVRTEYLND